MRQFSFTIRPLRLRGGNKSQTDLVINFTPLSFLQDTR